MDGTWAILTAETFDRLWRACRAEERFVMDSMPSTIEHLLVAGVGRFVSSRQPVPGPLVLNRGTVPGEAGVMIRAALQAVAGDCASGGVEEGTRVCAVSQSSLSKR